MASDAIVLSVVIESVPGREDELASRLIALVEPTRSEAGCIGYELNISTEKPGTFFFYEKFADEASLEAHVNSPHFKDLLKYREGNDPVARQVVMRWTPAI